MGSHDYPCTRHTAHAPSPPPALALLIEGVVNARSRPRSRRRVVKAVGVVTDPIASARAAGLRYVSDAAPGIQRRRVGRGFVYTAPDGARVTDPLVLRRIRALAIPPAWRDVWICPLAHGHLQAVGRDARGRKQYRYHGRWRSVRDESKYARLLAFGAALPTIRERVDRDLARPGLPREKVLATVVRLLETTFIRVGNEEYAKANGSFGLTTLRGHHVDVSGSTLRFEFRGKGGKRVSVDLTDRRLARIVKRCQELPGQELFQYVDADGARQTVDSADVNGYLREIAGEEFTAKDFRTWAGTVLAALALREIQAGDSTAQAKRNVVRAVESVSRQLGNTPAICRRSYVHPAVIDTYLDGTVIGNHGTRPPTNGFRGLRPDEASVLLLLRKRLERDDLQRAA
jgi:DNA topoisomerase I